MASAPKHVAHMIGQVEEVSRLLNAVLAIATSRIPVLLLGPRSTGIDLLAKAIHTCSPREARPFITARCGLSPAAAIEAQLLGGAPARRSNAAKNPPADDHGQIAAANSGSLFLDQIQNTSPQIQSELLRIVNDGEYVDSEGITHRTDIRLIVSAWHDLKDRADEARFRPDLYERLSRVSLQLRKGSSDQEHILEVVDLFRGKLPSSPATPPDAPQHDIAAQVFEALRDYTWSEDIMTLKYAIKETAASLPPEASPESVLMETLRKMGHQKSLSLAHQNLQAASAAIERCVEAYETFDGHLYDKLVSSLQRTLIERVMIQCNGTITRAAEILGVNVSLLQSKLHELGLDS